MDEGQIAAFQRDGYLLLRGFFNADEVADITRWTEELASAPEEVGRALGLPGSQPARSGRQDHPADRELLPVP